MPTIFGQKSSAPADSVRPMKFSNLSELANAHLNSNKLADVTQKTSQSIDIPHAKRSKFIIPKLHGGNSSVSLSSAGESLTPHELSLKKIMDAKRLENSNQSNDDEMRPDSPNATFAAKQQSKIDLASALNGPNANQSIVTPSKPVVEQIDFKFIDCDIVETNNAISADCCLNLSHILNENIENRTKTTTAFGKILCSKYKRSKQKLIKHGFVHKNHIKPFRFDVPRSAK